MVGNSGEEVARKDAYTSDSEESQCACRRKELPLCPKGFGKMKTSFQINRATTLVLTHASIL